MQTQEEERFAEAVREARASGTVQDLPPFLRFMFEDPAHTPLVSSLSEVNLKKSICDDDVD